MYKIYIVEDEKDLANVVKSYLEQEGYEVVIFNYGYEAISNIKNTPSLWVLDIMLEDEISGYDIIKKIREYNKNTPVIFTSARDKDIDRILGLEMRSDDYLIKPYSVKELVIRINKILTRVYKEESNIEMYESYIINKDHRSVTENEIQLKLTTTELDLLLLFILNKSFVFSREQIIEKMYKDGYFGSDRSIDDLVRRLRKKMPKLRIETVYGFGYKLL